MTQIRYRRAYNPDARVWCLNMFLPNDRVHLNMVRVKMQDALERYGIDVGSIKLRTIITLLDGTRVEVIGMKIDLNGDFRIAGARMSADGTPTGEAVAVEVQNIRAIDDKHDDGFRNPFNDYADKADESKGGEQNRKLSLQDFEYRPRLWKRPIILSATIMLAAIIIVWLIFWVSSNVVT